MAWRYDVQCTHRLERHVNGSVHRLLFIRLRWNVGVCVRKMNTEYRIQYTKCISTNQDWRWVTIETKQNKIKTHTQHQTYRAGEREMGKKRRLESTTTWAKYANKMVFSCMKQSFYALHMRYLCICCKQVAARNFEWWQMWTKSQTTIALANVIRSHSSLSYYTFTSSRPNGCTSLRPTCVCNMHTYRNLRLTKYSVEYLSLISLPLILALAAFLAHFFLVSLFCCCCCFVRPFWKPTTSLWISHL